MTSKIFWFISLLFFLFCTLDFELLHAQGNLPDPVTRKSLKAKADSLYKLSNKHFNSKDYLPANIHLTESIRIYEELRDTTSLLQKNYFMATMYVKLSQYEKALGKMYYIFDIMNVPEKRTRFRANCWNRIGSIYTEYNKQEEARRAFDKGLEIIEAALPNIDAGSASYVKYHQLYSDLLNNKANIFLAKAKESQIDEEARYQKALILYDKAIDIQKKLLQTPVSQSQKQAVDIKIALYNRNRAEVIFRQGNFKEAMKLLESTLDTRRAAGDISGEMSNLKLIGEIQLAQQQFSLAQQSFFDALQLARDIKDNSQQAQLHQKLRSLFQQKKDFPKALYHSDLAKQMEDSIFTFASENEFALLEVTQKTKEKEKQIIHLEKDNQLKTTETKRQRKIIFSILAFLLFAIGGVLLIANRNRIIRRQKAEVETQKTIIEKEKQKSEELLLNILPPATAAELKASGSVQPRFYENASVIFVDIAGFTTLVNDHFKDPTRLVEELNYIYAAFDNRLEQFNVEKIKTIGDCYMAVCGVPEANKTNPVDIVLFAKEILDFSKTYETERTDQGLPFFRFRIGIHTGPVTAGVVGVKKFAFDIWGDAVNIASRMESAGEADRINISESTHLYIKDQFKCIPRGKIPIKGKEAMQMYFVEV